ncbi:MAG: phosphoribosylformylglycinamidine synthase subunit PurS [Bdellovibrionales bacterium]|nr:phosphoribosylformylglycinamidine synthase subunit PurS [Bdellovibrionales bacterium]
MMIIGVKILLKEEVLDVQGRAIAETLKRRDYSIEDCRYGKFLELKVSGNNKEEILEQAKKMAESVLCNSLVESYELEVLSEDPVVKKGQ